MEQQETQQNRVQKKKQEILNFNRIQQNRTKNRIEHNRTDLHTIEQNMIELNLSQMIFLQR